MATPTSIIIRCESEQCLITDEVNVVVMYDNDSDSELSDAKHNHHNSHHNNVAHNCQNNNNNGCESEECDVNDGDMDTRDVKQLDTQQTEEHQQKACDESQSTESQTTTATTITTATIKPIIMTAESKALRSMLKKGCASDSSSGDSSGNGNSNGKSAKRVTFSETMMVFCDDWPPHLMPQVVALKSPTDFNLVEAQGYMFEPPAEYQDFLPFEPPPDYRDFIANSLSAYDNDLSINFIDDDDEDSNDAHSSDNKLLTNNNNNNSSDNSHQNYINEMSSKWESMILNNSECMEEEQIIGVLREDALLQAIGSHVSLPEEHLCEDDFPIHFHKSSVKETCETVNLAESELSDITSDDGNDESSPTGSQQDIASDSSITSQDTIILINDNDDDNNASYIALNNIDLSDDLTSSEKYAKSEECCLVVDNNTNASTSGDDFDIVTILENRLNKEKLDNNSEKELNENNERMSENELNNAKDNLDSSNSNVTSNSNNGCESEECNINDGHMDTTDATFEHLDTRLIEEQQTCDDSQTTAKVCDGEERVNNALSDYAVPDDDKKVLTVIASCGTTACSSSTSSTCSDGSQMNDTQCATNNASFKRNLMFYENMLSESNKIMESNIVKTKTVLKQTSTCAPFIICSQSNTNPSSTTSYIVVSNNRTDDNKSEKYVNQNNLLDNSGSNNKCAKNLLTGDNDNSIDYNNVNHRSIKVNGEAIQMITHPSHPNHPPPPHPHQHQPHQRCLQPNHHNWPSDEFIIEYTSEPRTLVPSKRTSSLSSFPNALAMSNSNSNNQQKVMINNANYMSLNRVSCDAQQQQQLKQWRLYNNNTNTNTNQQQQHSACPHIVRYQYQQQRLQRPILPPNQQQPQQQFFLIRPQFTRAQYPSPPPQTNPNPNQCSYSSQSSQPQPIQRCRSPVPPVPHHTHTQLPLQRPPQNIPPQQQQQQQPQQQQKQPQQQPLRTVIRFTNSMSQTLPHQHKQPPPYDYHILAHHSNKFPHASEIRRRDGLNAYPHVLRQTPQPGSLPVPPVHHNSHNAKQMLTKDELEQFVQQDMQRTERIKKRYSLSEEDDPSFGFARRPSVRGIRPKYCSTTEIIKQMQTNSNAVSTGLQIVTNHLSWPATLNNPTNV